MMKSYDEVKQTKLAYLKEEETRRRAVVRETDRKRMGDREGK